MGSFTMSWAAAECFGLVVCPGSVVMPRLMMMMMCGNGAMCGRLMAVLACWMLW